MSVSPFDHPYLSDLFADADVGHLFSVEEDMLAMLRFESALARVQGNQGCIPSDAAAHITKRTSSFKPNLDALRQATARDGVVVPELIRQLKSHVGVEFAHYVHVGATSQDVIDTSLILRLKKLVPLLKAHIQHITDQLSALDATFGRQELMGRTRMQRALPIQASQKIQTWRAPLLTHLKNLEQLTPDLLQLQFGGAVGDLAKLGEKAPAIKKELAEELGLGGEKPCWHTDRTALVNFASWLSCLSGSLGKMGQDMVLMSQNEVGEITLKKGGGSSAMPHKQNPVQAELLVTLSKFNAVQISAMHQALVHENERSGISWALEWMVLPQMGMATAAGLKTAGDLLANIKEIGNSK